MPPEFLGAKALEDLSEQEWKIIQKHYLTFEQDLRAVGGYVPYENINMLIENIEKAAKRVNTSREKLEGFLTKIQEDLQIVEETIGINLGPITPPQKRYENFANNFLIAFLEREEDEARRSFVEAAKIRRCLG